MSKGDLGLQITTDKCQCSSLLEGYSGKCPSPPVSSCCDCDKDLVSYHECDVNLYTAQGLHNVERLHFDALTCCTSMLSIGKNTKEVSVSN